MNNSFCCWSVVLLTLVCLDWYFNIERNRK